MRKIGTTLARVLQMRDGIFITARAQQRLAMERHEPHVVRRERHAASEMFECSRMAAVRDTACQIRLAQLRTQRGAIEPGAQCGLSR